MTLEICASSFSSAKAAVAGGALRIELCSELSTGGLTPSAGLLHLVLNELEINTQVLIRPRGGDFCYCEEEIQTMLHDIHYAKKAGAHGVVFGALTPDNQFDIVTMERLAQAAQGIEYSCHKAFDELADPKAAIPVLANMGFSRILSSGGQKTALDGLDNLITWNDLFQDLLELMPGGSIRPQNIAQFVNRGFKSVHSAAIPPQANQTSAKMVAQLANALKS